MSEFGELASEAKLRIRLNDAHSHLTDFHDISGILMFQRLGVRKGDSVKEIESITEKMSKEDIMKGIRNARGI